MDQFNVIHVTPADQPHTRLAAVTGSMTIQYGAEIKAALEEALGAAQTVILDLEKVVEIDLIGLQFICSLHRTAISQQKMLIVIGAEREVIGEAMAAAGFARHIGCVQDVERTCIWAHAAREVTVPSPAAVGKQVAP